MCVCVCVSMRKAYRKESDEERKRTREIYSLVIYEKGRQKIKGLGKNQREKQNKREKQRDCVDVNEKGREEGK